jgi:hypothetical protein
LADQGWHDCLDVLTGMSCLHKGEDKANSFEEGSQRLVPNFIDSFPERLKDRVECLNAIGSRGLGKCRNSKSCHRLYLLLRIIQAIFDALD